MELFIFGCVSSEISDEQFGLSTDIFIKLMDFFHQVNGIDQGPAAANVPEKVYGVVGKGFFCLKISTE